MKRIISLLGLLLINTTIVLAGDVEFHIIPEAESEETVINMIDYVSKPQRGISGDNRGETVMERYTEIANGDYELSEKMASGILDRDTILDYLVYAIKFMSQVGILIGAIRIIYAGYCYATQIFAGQSGKGNEAIKNALLGVIIIVFSYAIMKLLTAAFLGS